MQSCSRGAGSMRNSLGPRRVKAAFLGRTFEKTSHPAGPAKNRHPAQAGIQSGLAAHSIFSARRKTNGTAFAGMRCWGQVSDTSSPVSLCPQKILQLTSPPPTPVIPAKREIKRSAASTFKLFSQRKNRMIRVSRTAVRNNFGGLSGRVAAAESGR